MEWKLIWHTFKQHIERKIIVVNFDQLEMKDNIDPKLRAFVRLGYDIDFVFLYCPKKQVTTRNEYSVA
jgi:hypothetical protein